MKAADIRPGEVYARRRAFGPPEPIMFLVQPGKGKRYTRRHVSLASRQPVPAFEKAWDARRGGFPAVVGGFLDDARKRRNRTHDDILAALRSVTFAEFEAAEVEWDGERGINYELIKSLATITGPYDEELAAYDEALREREEAQAAAQARQAARNAEEQLLRDRAEALGLHLGYANEIGSFVVPRATVLRLLDIAEMHEGT